MRQNCVRLNTASCFTQHLLRLGRDASPYLRILQPQFKSQASWAPCIVPPPDYSGWKLER